MLRTPNKLVLLGHKPTHTHIHAFTHQSCFTEEEGRHAAHTQGRVDGQLEVSPQVEVFILLTIIYVCGDNASTKTQHKCNRGSKQAQRSVDNSSV